MTQGQWLRLTGFNPSTTAADGRIAPGSARDLRRPVESVSWPDCERVVSGIELALPTEAQWECACRAGTTTPFWFGDEPHALARFANVASRELTAATSNVGEDWSDGWAGLAPVGSFPPNHFGLHDVLGNVAEWCEDFWMHDDDLPPRPGDGLRPGTDLAYRIQRGGALGLGFRFARCGARGYEAPEFRSPVCGVRPARSIRP